MRRCSRCCLRAASSTGTATRSPARCAITSGLSTPNSDACRIFIDGEPYSWRDGQDVLFDETFIHSAENKTDVTRIILFCDVERPLHTRWMTAFNRWVARHIIHASATQNVETEEVGALNRVYALFGARQRPADAAQAQESHPVPGGEIRADRGAGVLDFRHLKPGRSRLSALLRAFAPAPSRPRKRRRR